MQTHSQALSTTERSLKIIETIREQNGATVNRLASELALAESTIYKHLTTLAQYGFIIENGGEYLLGARFYDLGMHVRNRNKLYELAGKYVVELANRADEESDFGIEENGRIITLFDSIGNRNKPSTRTNNYEYMHTTAIGKAILAELPPSHVDEIIDRWELPELTPKTITSRAELMEELETVRRDGYAVNDRESIPGKRVTGRVVKHRSGYIIGGFTISGPEYRIEDVDLHQEFPDILQRVIQEFKSEMEAQNVSVSR
jgi:DNA-binding IclR family transcriptional regulator